MHVHNVANVLLFGGPIYRLIDISNKMIFILGLIIGIGLKKNVYEVVLLLFEYGSFMKEKKNSFEIMGL